MTKEELVEKKKKLIKQYFDDCQAISEKYKEWRLKNPHALDGPEIGEEKRIAKIFYSELKKINIELEKLKD